MFGEIGLPGLAGRKRGIHVIGFQPSAEQQAVIDQPVGPLRISAGAGTGKTTTLAARIAHLVDELGFAPESILGITFTNKAAEEMAERVRMFSGSASDDGLEVEIHTYHGFAAQILDEFGSLIGFERGAGIVTPTFARQIIHDVLATYPFHEINVTWRGTTDRIARLSGQLGDHLLTAEDISLPRILDDVWTERRDLLVAIAAYDAEKRRLGLADYADLVTMAYRLVAHHPHVRDRLRERYRAVVLDEYQDTNPAQRQLLRAIFPPGFPVMAVGDADQTIYEWRGASLENFERFPEHFGGDTPAPTLHLALNRRSGAAVLAVANAVRYEIDKKPRLALRPLDSAPDGAVYTRWERTAADEAAWLAGRMIGLHEQGRAWRDMAVLFRKNRSIGLVHDALVQQEIPVEVANLGGLLSVPEVTDLYCWLRLLHASDDGPALLRILTGGRFRLGLGDLMPLQRWVKAAWAEDDPADDHERVPPAGLVEAAERWEELGGLEKRAAGAIKQFIDEYRLLLETAQGVTLVELCRRILEITGTWGEVEAMPAARRLSARLNLYRFLDLAEDWSPLEGRPSLPAFVVYLNDVEAEPTEELDTARLSGEDAVTLLTVHRAKGLEWPVVFLPALVKDTFPARAGVYENPIRKAYFLPHELRLDRDSLPPIGDAGDEDAEKALLAERHMAQEWRIAYVAVTRAKEALYVSGSFWYGSAEPNKTASSPSALFELVAGNEVTTDLEGVSEPGEQPEVARLDWNRPAPDPLFEAGWEAGFREIMADPDQAKHLAAEHQVGEDYAAKLDEYRQLVLRLPIEIYTPPPQRTEVSVTGLVTYATCPRQYYWSEVDRLPRQPSSAASRGVDVHRRIELHNLGKVPFTEGDFDTYDLPEDSDPAAGNAFAIFETSRFATTRPLLVESPFQLSLGDDVWIRGRIDAVYPTDSGWEIVDFKSGRPSDRQEMKVQLQAYALAAHNVAFPVLRPDAVEVTFAYLGGGELVLHTDRADSDYLAAADQRIRAITASIREKNFQPTPGPACRSCDFLRFCDEGRRFVSKQPT